MCLNTRRASTSDYTVCTSKNAGYDLKKYFQAQKMLLSLDLNIDDILKIPDESLEILNIQGDERFDVKLEIQNEDDLFNEDDFKVNY